MAIVINGSGTVTGLSVGGLPDGTVDAGTLAANSVDSAELIDGAVDNSHMAAMAASKLTGALPAISGASLTNISTPYWSGKAGDVENVSRRVWTNLTCSQTTDSDNAFDGTTFTVPSGKAGKYFIYFSMLGNDDQYQLEDLRIKSFIGGTSGTELGQVQCVNTGNPAEAHFNRTSLNLCFIADLSVGNAITGVGYIADSAATGDRDFFEINMGGFRIG